MSNCAALIRHAIEKEAQGGSALAAKYLERIIPHLSGDFDPDSFPAGDADKLEARQDHLTERQRVLLDSTAPSAGPVCQRRRQRQDLARRREDPAPGKDGQRIGLFCYNKGLAEHLRRAVSTWRQAKPVVVGEFHEYAKSLGVTNGTGQEYFDQDMPRTLKELAATLDMETKLDEEARRRRSVRLHGRAAERLRPVGRRHRRNQHRPDGEPGDAAHRRAPAEPNASPAPSAGSPASTSCPAAETGCRCG